MAVGHGGAKGSAEEGTVDKGDIVEIDRLAAGVGRSIEVFGASGQGFVV
jgi:hypothetical protein